MSLTDGQSTAHTYTREVLDYPKRRDEASPIIQDNMKAAVEPLKMGKSARVDRIPSTLSKQHETP